MQNTKSSFVNLLVNVGVNESSIFPKVRVSIISVV
jgi:hypothetical protein